MAYSAFGVQDELTCITPTTFEGPGGEPVCLASKVSMYFLGGGVAVTDGGYVLRAPGGVYYKLDEPHIRALQAEGLVPTPLPPYRIPATTYVLGYSLWIAIVVVVLAALVKRMFGKLDPFLNTIVTPVLGPPMVRTDDDRWLTAELEKHLSPGERLEHQALVSNVEPGTTARGAAMYYAGLTDRRLIFLEAKGGFLGVTHEVTEVSSRDRHEVVNLGNERLAIRFLFADESEFTCWVVASQRRFTNQWLFARDVPKLLAAELSSRAPAA